MRELGQARELILDLVSNCSHQATAAKIQDLHDDITWGRHHSNSLVRVPHIQVNMYVPENPHSTCCD